MTATEHALYKGHETGSFGGPPTLKAPVLPSLFVLILYWKYLFASLASLRGDARGDQSHMNKHI